MALWFILSDPAAPMVATVHHMLQIEKSPALYALNNLPLSEKYVKLELQVSYFYIYYTNDIYYIDFSWPLILRKRASADDGVFCISIYQNIYLAIKLIHMYTHSIAFHFFSKQLLILLFLYSSAMMNHFLIFNKYPFQYDSKSYLLNDILNNIRIQKIPNKGKPYFPDFIIATFSLLQMNSRHLSSLISQIPHITIELSNHRVAPGE